MTEFLRFIQNSKFQQVIFFLLVLFLPTQLGKHFWPDFALVNGLRVDYLSPTLYVTDILAGIFIFIACVKKQIHFPVLLGFVFLFLSIGIYLSNDPMVGWYGLVKLLEYSLVSLAMIEFFLTTKKHNAVTVPFALGIIFESILGICQFFHQGSLGGLLYFFGERTFTADTPGIANASIHGALVLRPYATFSHPNVLAGYLVIGMTLLLSQVAGSKLKKMFYITTLFLGTIALLLTLSRVAIVLWILFLAYVLGKLFWQYFKKRVHPSYYILLFPIAVLTFLILFLVAFPLFQYRFFATSFTDESITSRISLMQDALTLIRKYPLFGVGFDNFLRDLPSSSFIHVTTGVLQPVHNVFLLIAAQLGIPILLLVIVFIVKTITLLFRQQGHSKGHHKLYVQGVVFALIFLICISMVDHYPITLQQGQLLVVLLFSLAGSANVGPR